MSWLGGSISSFTGQLSNLTKDILTEGTEEISDPTTELQLAREKLQTADTLNNAIRQENEKLKRVNRELEEKAESAEIQINNISREYRILLEEKEKENKELKQKQHELLDFQAKSALSVHDSPVPHITSSTHRTSNTRIQTGGFHEDDQDLGDSIRLQHEVNGLRQDVQRLRAECQHWRSVAGQLSGNQSAEEQTKHTESLQLKDRIQELQNQLIREKDHHQHEVISLQDVHHEKLATIKKTYKQDLARLEEKLSELQDNTSNHGDSSTDLHSLTQAKQTLEEENKEMKKRIESMSVELEKFNNEIKVNKTQSQTLQSIVKDLEEEKKKYEVELVQVRLALYEYKQRLLDQLDSDHTDIVDWITEMKEVTYESDHDAAVKRLKLLNETQDLDTKINEAGRKLRQAKQEASELQVEEKPRRVESEYSTSNLDVDQLKEENIKLQEEVSSLHKQNRKHIVEKDLYEERLKSYRRRLAEIQDDFEMDEEFDDSEFDLGQKPMVSGIDSNSPLDEQVRHLQSQVQQYQNDIEQFEYVKCDWQLEKEALEDVLMKLREELKQAESSLAVAQAQQGLEEVARQGTQPSLIVDDATETDEDTANKLASQINELVNGNQQLEEERDQLLQQVTSLEDKIQELEIETINLNTSLSQQQSLSGDIDEELKEKDKRLQTLQQEKDELETSLDQLDLQHQEEQTQLITIKDHLARKADELAKQLKENETIIADLTQKLNSQSNESEKDNSAMTKDLENKVEKLTNDLSRSNATCDQYAKEIDALKDKLQNGAVAEKDNSAMTEDLENKVEKLTDDLSRSNATCDQYAKEIEALKDKLQNGAVAVNDLHMDIRELESSLQKYKDELAHKSSKMKELKDANVKLKEENQNLEDKIEDLEDEVEKWQSINEKNRVGQTSSNSNFEADFKRYDEQLAEADARLEEATAKKAETDNTVQELTKLIEKLRRENDQLMTQAHNSSIEVETLAQASPVLNSTQNTDLETQLDAMSSEKQRLEKELDLLEQKLSNQTKHYEKYIKELEESKNMDESTLQQEHQRLAHILHEKERRISELNSQLEEVETELQDTKETMKTAVESQNQIATILQEKEEKIQSLMKVEVECDELKQKGKELEITLQSMQHLEIEVQRYQSLTEILKKDLEEAQALAQQNTEALNEKHKTLAVITDLETELTVATEKITSLEEIIKKQELTIADHVKGIALLNQKIDEQRHELQVEKGIISQHEDCNAVLQSALTTKEDDLKKLGRKLMRASSFLNDDQKAGIEIDRDPDYTLPAIEYLQDNNTNNTVNGFDEEMDQTDKVSKHLDQLQGKLGEKDQIITELQQKNSSLLKVLESKSLTSQNGEGSILDVRRLENEVKKLVTEKEQILAIMNEKSRESSSLKAEVHRLMNIVSAEKTALNKLQKDNHELTQKRDGPSPNDDMQKAALQQLSRLIRDKDVEIEALKQKNETLLAVLQDSSTDNSNNQLSTLLLEKENLSKRCAGLQSQNEQMIVYLNQKHQESVTYHNEVQRLSVIISEESQKYETIKEEYARIVPQFEEKKEALLKLQDELITYKQRFSELEIRYGEMLQRSNIKDTVDVTSFNAKEDELKRTQDKFQDLQKYVKEKDSKLQSLSQQRNEMENELVGKEADRISLKKQVEHLQFTAQGLQTELFELRSENSKWSQNRSEQDSEHLMLKEANNKLSLSLREKELELCSMMDKCDTLTNLMQDHRKDQGEEGQLVHQEQVDRLVQQMDVLRQQSVELQQERDQALLALQQQQENNNKLIKEVERLQEKEGKMTRELDRLRTHLIQIEEGYTREALDSEEREKELRNRVAIAEEKLLSTSTDVESASQHMSIQIEELKYQLEIVSSQRDAAYSQVTGMQDQCQQYASSLANLQLVLEQFQQDKEWQIASESEKYQEEIQSLKQEYGSVQNTLIETQQQLEEASEGLEAADRLSQQLDRKEEAVQALRDEVQLREKSLKLAEEEIRKLTSSTEAKVDKELMKNLLLGYFTTPQTKRKEVVHTIGGVLNFNPEEFQKISEAEGSSGGWVPGLFKLGRSSHPTPPTTPVRNSGTKAPSLNQSFSQLFVKFLETESSPPPPAVRLPAEQMAKELQEKHHREKETTRLSKPPAFNPFTAPRHVSMPISVGTDRSAKSDSHILMGSTNTPSFTPMFTTPVANDNISQPNSGRSTPQNSSSAILKDVLGSR
ncbi:thyroid receptor-interacting protein 11 isoform X2 [Patella vulgata]|uniref:thyroid receptor-interacting protein 11 isoform X2 n=1 Tax=Patella vulgata TaxID=6465 RepID=UPI00217F4A1D|nr:thyroid receptor-interacting protein 11 isoform X2 [Patella vulgata]